MYETTLSPNFNKLKAFYPNITDSQINQIEQLGGVPINLEYLSEDDFLRVSEGLKTILQRYQLEEHHTELLYLILLKNEDIAVRYDARWQSYNDDQTSRDVAKFLLTYKTSNPDQPFQLTAKAFTGSASIKSPPLARWMCEVIFTAIEKQEFPPSLFGAKVYQDLFGNNPFDVEEISMERLEACSNLNPRKPTVKLRKLYVELCQYLQLYLINETPLTLPEGARLTDAQANLFFDMLELLGYINKDNVESESKDYMHAMFRNQMA